MMKRNSNNVDELLKCFLSSDEQPDAGLIWKVKYKLNQEEHSVKRSNKAAYPIRAIAIAVVLVLMATTALAAGIFLKPSEVSEIFGDQALSAAFDSESAVKINESVTSGDYIFTLLGIVTGDNISDLPHFSSAGVNSDRTYAVLAIQKADGTPMPDTSDDAYGEVSFFATPLVKGLEPWIVNAASLHGNYGDTVVDGIMYRLVECDNVAMFADRGLYFAVCTEWFINNSTFSFDETTGEISVNPDYNGASAVFDLPIDESLADPELAEQYLASMY